MNDFTKEELEDISYAIEMASLNNFSLKDKLESMIENYCEHEWVNGVYCDICGINR
jgi:hypothetical protein